MEPIEIPDLPVPLIQGGSTQVTGSSSNPVVSTGGEVPSTNLDEKFPQRIVAHETLSQSLNTETKRILGEYSFESLGAIRIGEFSQGVSGEIDISPDGIIGKNVNGDITFAIDGTTGDATFKGEITGGTISIGNNFTVDSDGNVIATSIKLSNSGFVSVAAGFNQVFTSSTEVDVLNSAITFTLQQAQIVLIMVSTNGWVYNGAAGNWIGRGILRLYVDGLDKGRCIVSGGLTGTDSFGSTSGNAGLSSGNIHYLVSLSAGSHTIKLTGAVDNSGGTPYYNVYNYRISYITLGNS